MPLSDEEMRLLEQMERALVEEDPKFASTLRGTRFAQATRIRIIVASVAFVIGMAVLLTGAVLGTTAGIVVGVVGFVVMLGSATVGLSAWHGRQAAAERNAQPTVEDFDPTVSGLSLLQGGRQRRPKRAKPAKRQSGESFMQRMEQRWQRRRDGRNGGY